MTTQIVPQEKIVDPMYCYIEENKAAIERVQALPAELLFDLYEDAYEVIRDWLKAAGAPSCIDSLIQTSSILYMASKRAEVAPIDGVEAIMVSENLSSMAVDAQRVKIETHNLKVTQRAR